VFLQQLQIFFLKSFLAMMFPLVLDVLNHIQDLGLADREPTISVLPLEGTQLLKFFVNPF